MSDHLKKEIIALCKLLKSSWNVTDVDLLSEGDVTAILITIANVDDLDWEIVKNIFTKYFLHYYDRKIELRIKQPPAEVEPKKEPPAKQPTKIIGDKIIVYNTESCDWRLFRYHSDTIKKLDENYYGPSQTIARMETTNLDRTFLFAAGDVKSRRISKNIIELNVNCLTDKILKNEYLFFLRQLPRQLRNRFAISLVRISSQLSEYEIKQAATICRMCVDDLFLSFSYKTIPTTEQLAIFSQVNGFIITLGKDDFQNLNDIKLIYEKIDNHFKGKLIFLIFDGNIIINDSFYSFRNIKQLLRKDLINLTI